MPPRRILVLGATGMLGHKLCQQLSLAGHAVVGATRRKADDLRRIESVYGRCELLGDVDVARAAAVEDAVARAAPEILVNAVGIIKQKKEAQDGALCESVNAELPHRLASLAAQRNFRLIHISTDCVFDGVRGRYRETDPTNATDLYGQSKAKGETAPAETAALTLRTGVIGREILPPTHGLLEWILSQKGKTVRGFARAIYSGLTILEFCRIIARLVESPPALTGTVQVAGPFIDKYELLRLVDRIYQLKMTIQKDEEFQCDRSMVPGRFAEATGYRAPSWPSMIEELAQDPTPYDRILTGT